MKHNLSKNTKSKRIERRTERKWLVEEGSFNTQRIRLNRVIAGDTPSTGIQPEEAFPVQDLSLFLGFLFIPKTAKNKAQAIIKNTLKGEGVPKNNNLTHREESCNPEELALV